MLSSRAWAKLKVCTNDDISLLLFEFRKHGTKNLMFANVHWMSFSPSCCDVEVYTWVCQYTMTSHLGAAKGVTEHIQPRADTYLKLSSREGNETLLFTLVLWYFLKSNQWQWPAKTLTDPATNALIRMKPNVLNGANEELIPPHCIEFNINWTTDSEECDSTT